ncbi:MAG: hypothetical protein RIC55_26585 [Pirellulaceae bacterium]
MRHIEEARQLSVELGGTDKDVKAYFFDLLPHELRPILDAYEQQHGKKARDYAKQTFEKWRSGATKMSGLVAGRLFELLPRFMPRKTKFDLVKSLWESKCPTSRKVLYVGPDALVQEVCCRAREHLTNAVIEYTIPESITRRFRWLAEKDVELQQELYNYFLQLNREAVIEASEVRIPALLTQLAQQRTVQRISQTIVVANHSLELVFDPEASGVSSSPPVLAPSIPERAEANAGCLIAIVVATVLALLLFAAAG